MKNVTIRRSTARFSSMSREFIHNWVLQSLERNVSGHRSIFVEKNEYSSQARHFIVGRKSMRFLKAAPVMPQ